MVRFRELPELLWIRWRVSFFQLREYIRVLLKFYGNQKFASVDWALLRHYFFQSPYAISKQFHQERGEEEIYVYGETPLTSLEQITQVCEITKHDTIYELGCGRGRGCFWWRIILGASVVGVEYIPLFVTCAEEVRQRFELDKMTFLLEDILAVNYSDATAVFLYGTCFEDSFLLDLVQKLKSLPEGAKVITVSFPLTDYLDDGTFSLVKTFSVPFNWGEGEVFLHIREGLFEK